MFELLHKYFIQNHSIGLPGIGTISALGISARTDFPNERILAPSLAIHFDRSHDSPSKDLYNYISRQKNIDEWEAVKMVNDFAFEVRNEIRAGREVFWGGIGTLRGGVTGEIILEPLSLTNDYAPEVTAKRVIRTGERHSILVGDHESTTTEMSEYLQDPHHGEVIVEKKSRWWIYAIILAAIALIILFIHFSQKGSFSIHNEKKLEPAESPKTYDASSN